MSVSLFSELARMSDIERCLLVKQEVFVYKIPPRQVILASDWSTHLILASYWSVRPGLQSRRLESDQP